MRPNLWLKVELERGQMGQMCSEGRDMENRGKGE